MVICYTISYAIPNLAVVCSVCSDNNSEIHELQIIQGLMKMYYYGVPLHQTSLFTDAGGICQN